MIYALAILILSACSTPAPVSAPADVAIEYQCAAAQMKRVRRETAQCLKESYSWQDACEEMAKRKHCGGVR